MNGLVKTIYMAQNRDTGRDGAISKLDQWTAVLEATLVTFAIALIPDLIVLGGPPTCITDIWKPFMSALLMAVYTYSRARGINIPDEVRRTEPDSE